ncbi:AarF/UbiB family protein [Actinomarinicola tropica]|uniref:Phosphotransferase n=1 Tax=Actinomarinicola tropica TaxID=2789776 RepID=A0A5Q2RJ97_9ACTN|nr:phosphotransferase [Actinomarinicola tropica]
MGAALKREVRAWLEAALVHGFFHGDVHAGNLMLDTDGEVVFLDFGICGSFDDETREIVRRGLPALLVSGDFEAVAQAIFDMGPCSTRRAWSSPLPTSPRSSSRSSASRCRRSATGRC